MPDDPNFNLLRERIKDVNGRMSRAALLLLAVVTIVGYATSRATRDVERLDLRAKFSEAVVLAAASRDYATQERVTAASPARQFFLLSSLVAEPVATFSDAADRAAKDRQQARTILAKYKALPAEVDPAQPAPVLSTCPGTDRDPATVAECRAAIDLATRFAGEVERGYADAFTVSVGAAGAQLPIDLRNWLAFVPLGLILAGGYFYLLSHERAVLYAVGRQLVRSATDPPKMERLAYPLSGSARPLQGPATRLAVVLVVGVLGLQFRHLITAWQTLVSSETDDVVMPLLIVGMTLVFYAMRYCSAQSRVMDETVRQETGVTLTPGVFAQSSAYLAERWQLILARGPRRVAGTSAVLILLTLWLPSAATSCGPVPGYFLISQPMSPAKIVAQSVSENDDRPWWLPAMTMRKIDGQGFARRVAEAGLVLDQEAGFALYGTALATAVIALTGMIRSRRTYSGGARILGRVSHVAACFFTADMTWLFTGAKVRLALLVVILPLAIVALWPGSPGRARAVVQKFGRPLVIPLFAAGQIFWGVTAVMDPAAFSGFAVLTIVPFPLSRSLMAIARQRMPVPIEAAATVHFRT